MPSDANPSLRILATDRPPALVHESGRVLETLLRNLDGMMYRCRDDEHWTMEFVSDGCYRVTGYQPEDLLFNRNVSYESLVHPDDRACLRQVVSSALAARERFEVEYRLLHADGSERWVFERGIGVMDDANKLIALEGFVCDITQRKQAQQASWQAEQRYLGLFDNAPIGIFRTSVDGQYIDANPALARIYGFASRQELIASLRDIQHQLYVHAKRREEFRAEISAKGTVSHFQSQVYRKNGDVIWISENARAVLDEHGEVQYYEGTVEDITELKRVEQNLRDTQQRLERAIRGTNDGLWETDLISSVVWFAPRVWEMLGYAADEIPSTWPAIRALVHPDDEATLDQGRTDHLEHHRPYDIEYRIRCKDGAYKWVRVRGRCERDATGQPISMAGSLQDITEVKQFQQSLIEATEAASAASRAKSAILANVSHEIRTPMNGVIGMAELLLETNLDRTQRDYAETIRTSADALLTIINDILDFSKIEAGKMEMESIEMDLRGNVEDVGTMMAVQAAVKQIELIVNISPDVPERMLGDPQRIRQCLINLVGNAIKFTRVGEIVVSVHADELDQEHVNLQFEVRDTGIGIPADAIDTLFEPFVQADASTTRHFGGTGLGLSIVRRLIEMMGGKVGVSSELGKGSVFWFNVPTRRVEMSGMHAALRKPIGGKRVLIVDDNDTNRRVIAAQLEHAGYNVELAATGHQALTIMRQALGDNRAFDVVLADYQMADMDGAMLGERINADAHLSRARVVVMTAINKQGDVQRFAALGLAGYLSKPVRTRELLACLERVVARDWLQTQPIMLQPATQAQRFKGRVLLVEDNTVNQKVAQRFLQRLGCTVIITNNGVEAVTAYERDKFDLVLMDLQMPVMDGFAATRRIRDFEGWRPRTPIVALTANAMTGQSERCLAAGMQDFLTKPLENERLCEVLGKYLRPADDVSNEALSTEAITRTILIEAIEAERFQVLVAGDPEFAKELIEVYLESGAQVLNEMRVALARDDRQQLQRAAHKLKGASANICATELREQCALLESSARDNGIGDGELNNRVDKIATEIERTKLGLARLLNRLTQPD